MFHSKCLSPCRKPRVFFLSCSCFSEEQGNTSFFELLALFSFATSVCNAQRCRIGMFTVHLIFLEQLATIVVHWTACRTLNSFSYLSSYFRSTALKHDCNFWVCSTVPIYYYSANSGPTERIDCKIKKLAIILPPWPLTAHRVNLRDPQQKLILWIDPAW